MNMYKIKSNLKVMRKNSWEKRGQMTIFIIVAILIVALVGLAYAFYPEIKTSLGFEEDNPNQFLQSCLEEDIKSTLNTISLQGGSLTPSHYIMYDDSRVEYLCYTSEYYKTCVMQQPMLESHIEKEIEKAINEQALECLQELDEKYRSKGYSVDRGGNKFKIELLPDKVLATFDTALTLTSTADSSKRYESIRFMVDNNLYELVSIANSILNMEAHYGDAETTIYMDYYRNLKVEKKTQSDGSTVYVLTEADSGNKFMFASRSVAWPPGYSTEVVF